MTFLKCASVSMIVICCQRQLRLSPLPWEPACQQFWGFPEDSFADLAGDDGSSQYQEHGVVPEHEASVGEPWRRLVPAQQTELGDPCNNEPSHVTLPGNNSLEVDQFYTVKTKKPSMGIIWQAQVVMWLSCDSPRVLEVRGSAEVSIRRRTQLAMTCVSGVLWGVGIRRWKWGREYSPTILAHWI